jgi:hypothetical protein
MSEPRVSRATLAVAGLLVALSLAGCSQEGKLVQNPLPASGVGADFAFVTHTDTTVVLNIRFKIDVHVANACELQHNVLALRLLGTNPVVYEISPSARYNADDKCTLDTSGPRDTVLTLNVNGVPLGKADGAALTTDVGAYTFQVVTPGAPPITLVVDSLVTDFTANTAQFDVRVEDATTGAPIAGANVAVDQLGAGGTATPLDSLLTDAQGLASPIMVPAPVDTAGAPNLPYRVRVVSGVKSTVFSAPSFPARFLRREKLVIRI